MTLFLLIALLAPPTPFKPPVEKLHSPKVSEQKSVARMAVVPPKPRVFRLPLTWKYPRPLGSNETFVLCYGTQPGQWPNMIATGSATNYPFTKTNWVERGLRHFYIVRNGTNGPPSNEIHYPPYAPNRIALTWIGKGRTVLFSSPTLAIPVRQWPILADVTGTNRWDGPFTPAGTRFYATTNGEVPKILLYNPLN